MTAMLLPYLGLRQCLLHMVWMPFGKSFGLKSHRTIILISLHKNFERGNACDRKLFINNIPRCIATMHPASEDRRIVRRRFIALTKSGLKIPLLACDFAFEILVTFPVEGTRSGKLVVDDY